MKHVLLNGWHFMRIFRLALGTIILIQGIVSHDALSAGMGGFLSFMAVLNTGCCGYGGCSIMPGTQNQSGTNKSVTYEEIPY